MCISEVKILQRPEFAGCAPDVVLLFPGAICVCLQPKKRKAPDFAGRASDVALLLAGTICVFSRPKNAKRQNSLGTPRAQPMLLQARSGYFCARRSRKAKSCFFLLSRSANCLFAP